MFAYLIGSTILIGAVLFFLIPGAEPKSSPVMVGLVLVTGTGGLALAIWTRSRPLMTGSEEELGASFASASFTGLAAAQLPATMGFVGATITRTFWVFLVGAGFSAVAFSLVAPTMAAIRRRDEELAAQGCPYSLLEALQQPSAGGTARR
jgi:hypothetical protein